MDRKTFSTIGALLGTSAFLAVGLLPALAYGGYAGLLLAGGIFGTPLHETLPVRAMLVGGMALGVSAVASLFTVLGAVVGAGLAVAVEAQQRLTNPAHGETQAGQ